MLTGSLDALANYVGFAITLFAGTAVAAVFVLRAREPNAPRPFKALGYPWTPAIFVLVSCAIVVNAFYSRSRARPAPARLIILAGIPLYYFFTQERKHEQVGSARSVKLSGESCRALSSLTLPIHLRATQADQVAPIGGLPSRVMRTSNVERLVAGQHDLDLVLAFFEPQRLEHAVEVVDAPGVVAVDVHLRVARVDLSAAARRR